MPNYARVGFSVYVVRGKHRLTLCRSLRDLDSAVAAARSVGRQRPVGVDGMVIRCEQSRRQWTVGELVDARSAAREPQDVAK